MSKTKGNVIDPIETIETMGTDALRLSLVTGVTPGVLSQPMGAKTAGLLCLRAPTC